MDIDDFKPFDGERLTARIQALSRSELDDLFRRFGTQYALLCQRLEAIYSPDRIDRFARIRPGGLDEIDEMIRLAEAEGALKEITPLKAFRELNRVLAPFMDVFEERALTDLQFMSKEELEELERAATQLEAAIKLKAKDPSNYRAIQNAEGTIRLTTLMRDAIAQQLKDRFGVEPE